jgi:hypothetical protein
MIVFIINNLNILFSTFESAVNILSKIDFDIATTYLIADEVHNMISEHNLCNFCNQFKNSLYLSATIPEEF